MRSMTLSHFAQLDCRTRRSILVSIALEKIHLSKSKDSLHSDDEALEVLDEADRR